jgi:penicillin-binding protein 2
MAKKFLNNSEIEPDEIFLDSSNLPKFDQNQFEGRLEKPIQSRSVLYLSIFFLVILLSFVCRLWYLQIAQGEYNNRKAENNRLRQTPVFAERGLIYDRNHVLLAWNMPNEKDSNFSLRQYSDLHGLSHVLGYVKYPTKDSSGFYYREQLNGVDGIEKFDNTALAGTNGLQIIETNASGNIQSESVINPPVHGENITLSIDAAVQSELYKQIGDLVAKAGFVGGAGVIMDVHTGEILAMTSFPEFSSQIMTDGKDRVAIDNYNKNSSNPFLDKVISGLYTPGSIVKPYVALAALQEKIIDPSKQILSTGSITVPNPYYPELSSVFRDWKALGLMDMRHALAMSSDIYFYTIGGGFGDQKGLGINMIDSYLKLFGFGATMGSGFFDDKVGTIPTPEWKAKNFNGETWRLGDTYHTAIGQYGFQVTPIQVVRAVVSIANGGFLLEPTIFTNQPGQKSVQKTVVPIDQQNFQVVRDGMRLGVTDGISVVLNVPYVSVASKTGTAELGVTKALVNSWVTGFFPYDDPHYAFAVIMEKGSRDNLTGSIFVMRGLFDWMSQNAPQYLK